MLVQQVVGVPRIVFYTEAPPAPSDAAHIAAEVPTELSATEEQGVFNPMVSPPTSGAGVNSGLLKHQRLSEGMFPLYSVLSTSNYPVAGRLAHFIQN